MCVTACRISGPFYNCYDRRGRTTFQRRPDLNATSRTNPDNSPPGAPFTFFSSAILLSLSPSLPPFSLSLRSNIYSIKSHRSSVTFFNFISSSCFPFFLSLLSLLPSHFLYIFHGTLTEKQRGGGVGLCKRTTARSGICPEFQQLLPAFLTGKKKRSVLSCFSRGKYHRGGHGNRFSPLRNLLDIPLPSSSRTLGKLVSVFINVAMRLLGRKIRRDSFPKCLTP